MKRIGRKAFAYLLICGITLCLFACQRNRPTENTSANESQIVSTKSMLGSDKKKLAVSDISAERVSSSELKVKWSFAEDSAVESYSIMRRCEKDAKPEWEAAGMVPSDGSGSYLYNDKVDGSTRAQYSYRIDVIPKDKTAYQCVEGKIYVISNLLVCIDPGHFLGASHLAGKDLYGFEESVATLRIGISLSKILKEEYGITSYLTRTGDQIKINGLTNRALDSGNISLRGEYAAGSDLFISLHTNANLNFANGCPTTSQPISINKPIIIANTYACRSGDVISMCNSIGDEITKVYENNGLATVTRFEHAEPGKIKEWTNEYNDSLNVPGTVCKRVDKDGDYYGVLRGAAKVGIPGIIIEHGHHTIPEFRNAAMNGDLLERLARADAAGIAGYIK